MDSVTAAAVTLELEQTLRVCDEARVKLSMALDRALSALSSSREDSSAARARLSAVEQDVRRLAEELSRLNAENARLITEVERFSKEAARRNSDLEESRRALEQERVNLLSEVNRAMENAEKVRREGIEAFEHAREHGTKSP